jgi:hypothetical protein
MVSEEKGRRVCPADGMGLDKFPGKQPTGFLSFSGLLSPSRPQHLVFWLYKSAESLKEHDLMEEPSAGARDSGWR